MKHVVTLFFLGAAALGTLLPAGQPMASYAEAKPHLQSDGCVFFAYAEGWDAFSRKRCEALMASTAIQKAAGNAVLIPLPIPERPDEARTKRQQELCGGLQVPGASSYPALLFFNARGQHYATLCGAEVARGKPAQLAELVAARVAGGRERTRLLAEAEKQQGPQKAALLARAYQIEGLSWPGRWVSGELAKLDPKDESGARRSWDFNAYGFAEKVDGMELSAALAEVDKLLADQAYTNVQKQRACAAALGVLRRKGDSSHLQEFERYAGLLESYAPQTPEGKAAGYIRREWAPGLHYGKGWSPAALVLGTKPVELLGELPIKGAGTYTVTFTYTHGPLALAICAVELYDGKTKVAEDRHDGWAGNRHTNHVYTLRVERALREPHLFITTKMNRRDSYGKITIEKK